MKSTLYNNIAITALVGTANLICAALLHRAIVHNQFLIHRRRFYEAMSVLGFVFALALTAFSAAVWPHNNTFVIICTTVWALFCCLLVVGLQRNERHRLARSNLEIPNLWNLEQESDKHQVPAKARITYEVPPGRVQVTIDAAATRTCNAERLPDLVGGDSWHSTLRKSRRFNLSIVERNHITNLWFRKNRSAYDCPANH